jgi:hypothetical protein
MKKLIMITAMFMAMNTWSASDYLVCEWDDNEDLTKCVNRFINKGYQPVGGVFVAYTKTGHKKYFQSLIKFD